MLEDTLRHETPDAVLRCVLCMIYGESKADTEAEAANRMALDGLRFSKAKLDAARASIARSRALKESGRKESLLSYVFPLLRFHDRWSELTREDFQYYFTRRQLSVNGFVMRCDVRPPGWIPDAPLLPNYDFSALAWECLDRIRSLCEEKGIQLLLFKAPSLTPHWYPEWDAQIADYAGAHGLHYLNALDHLDDIGLNFDLDTYDEGLHLNLSGAEKMARYLGAWLELDDLRGDPELGAAWAVKGERYRALQKAQEDEIARDGEVKTFFVPEITTPAFGHPSIGGE